MIGTGRVCATSAIRAPSVITISTPSLSAAARIASAKVRQRTLGSIPLSSTRSRSARGHADRQQGVRRPVDLACLSLDQADRRPVDLEVVELLRVDPRHDLRFERRRDRLQRRARRARGVVPAREGADEDGRAKLGRIVLPDHRVHGASLPGISANQAGAHRRRGSRTVRPGVHDRGVEAAVAISTGERGWGRDRGAAFRPAVRGSLRVRAQGPADGSQRRRLPGARAA